MASAPGQPTETLSTPITISNARTDSSSHSQADKRLYFAYGSNLFTTQMASRCPGSTPLHLAWVGGWKFIINQRGVANIVPDPIFDTTMGCYNPGVYGVLYEIDDDDEESLDLCEGVPDVYQKVEMSVWVQREGGFDGSVTGDGEGAELARKTALVYGDPKRTEDGRPRQEYVLRMNTGIREASNPKQIPGFKKRLPLPREYVEKVLRPFIPM